MTDTSTPVIVGGASGSNVGAGQGSVIRTAPAPRVNPETISSSKVGTTPAAPVFPGTTDGSNPTTATSFADYAASKALTPDEAKSLSDRFTNQLQAQNDLITAEFNARTSRQTDLNTAELARTRVLNTRSGNIDSGTGAAAVDTTTKKGKEALDALDEAKSAKISAALSQIDQLKEAAIEKATSKKSEDVKAYNDTLATNKKTAMESVKSLAAGDVPIDKIKSDKGPDGVSTYDKLLKASGLTPLEFDVQYNALHDTAHQIKYEYKTVGNVLFAYGNDPKTGKVTVTSQTVPGIESGKWSHFETKDGRLYKENADTGQVLPINAPVPDDTKGKGSNYTIPAASRNNLAKYGLPTDAISSIEKDIRLYGVQAVIDAQTDPKYKTAIEKVLGDKASNGGFDPTK